MNNKEIFIGGTGRCGTSIIGNIFRMHNEVFYFNEPRFLIDNGGVNDYLDGKVNCSQLKDKIISCYKNKMMAKLKSRVDVEFSIVEKIYCDDFFLRVFNYCKIFSDKYLQMRNLIDEIFKPLVQIKNAKFWAEKTPHTILMADKLYKIFPTMKYLHIIRDPRDVFSSTLCQSWGPKNTNEFISYYNNIMKFSYDVFNKIPEKNYIVVSIENVARNKSHMIPYLLDFVGLRCDSEFLDLCISSLDESKANIGRYKKDIGKNNMSLIEEQCWPIYSMWKKREFSKMQ